MNGVDGPSIVVHVCDEAKNSELCVLHTEWGPIQYLGESRLMVVSCEAKKGQSDCQNKTPDELLCVFYTSEHFCHFDVNISQLLNLNCRHKTFLPILTNTPKIKAIG